MEKKRILIIDDEPLIRRAMADYLSEFEYETVTATDGAEGLEQARTESFDVVLVDLRMPRVDGLEVIAALNQEQPELPVVVVSGTGVLSDAIEAMRQGAWDYITKPVQDIDEILVTVERVLEKATLIAERDQYRRDLEDINRSLEAEVARQTQDLRTQNRRLAALNRVSYAISDPLDLDTILNRALNATLAAFEADSGVVRLLNPATGKLTVAVARGLPESYLALAQAIPMGEGIVGQVAQSGRPHNGADFSGDSWMVSLKEGGFLSFLCAPLRAGDRGLFAWMDSVDVVDLQSPVVGTLSIIMHDRRDFDADEVDLLVTVGNQIGVAVARVQYAADLKQTNIRLEQANVELRRLDTLREQFTQNVTHELRTPLALVHGYVEMLVQDGLNLEEQKMALDVISRRVQTLVDLVDAVTTLQDLGSQPLRMEPISPSELVKTACMMAAQRASAAGIELQCDYPLGLAPFPGDFTRLAQALYQLLDNACKFSSEGTAVTVGAWLVPGENEIRISVADQGIGIPPDEQERIFGRFYQLNGSAARRYGGTGLGLALVKEIVGAHGGRVEVESETGEGSTFTVCLPLTRKVASSQ